MPAQRVHADRHSVPVAAPAGVVYGLLADAVRWPALLPSCVHVEQIDFDGSAERLRLWDLSDGRVRSRHVRRTLDPGSRSIAFEHWDTEWPADRVSGRWQVRELDEDHTLLTLRQERSSELGAVPPPDGTAERLLAEVRRVAERWHSLDELLLSFEDSVHVRGPAELVYDFLYRIGDWEELLPHVDWTGVVEDRPGVQLASVAGSSEQDGRAAVVETVRLCFPHAGRIVHKELEPPGLVAVHSGEWSLLPDEHGVTVVCAHRVMLREEAVEQVLGPDALPVDARLRVREELGRTGVRTLELAKWHAESAVRRLR